MRMGPNVTSKLWVLLLAANNTIDPVPEDGATTVMFCHAPMVSMLAQVNEAELPPLM